MKKVIVLFQFQNKQMTNLYLRWKMIEILVIGFCLGMLAIAGAIRLFDWIIETFEDIE